MEVVNSFLNISPTVASRRWLKLDLNLVTNLSLTVAATKDAVCIYSYVFQDRETFRIEKLSEFLLLFSWLFYSLAVDEKNELKKLFNTESMNIIYISCSIRSPYSGDITDQILGSWFLVNEKNSKFSYTISVVVRIPNLGINILNILKAVFYKFYLVQSWILCSMYNISLMTI